MIEQDQSFQTKDQDTNDFVNKVDQKLLFLDYSSFLQGGGHKGDEGRLQEPDADSSQQKERQILMSELVMNDTLQCHKETDENMLSDFDMRFQDLYPMNQKRSFEFSNEIIFKNCVSNYTQTDLNSKCNTPLVFNKRQLSAEIHLQNNQRQIENTSIQQQPSLHDTQKTLRMEISVRDNTDKTEIIYDSQQEHTSHKDVQKELSNASKLQRKKTSININANINFIKSVEVSKPTDQSNQSQDFNNLRSTNTPGKLDEKIFKGLQIINNINNQLASSQQFKDSRKDRIVKRFINYLYNLNPKRKLRDFQSVYYKLINDAAIWSEQKNNETQQQSIIFNFLNILKEFPIKIFGEQFILYPTDKILMFWKFFCLIGAIVFLFSYSITIVMYGEQQETNYMNYLLLSCMLLLFGDILITFNTAIYQKDIIISDKTQIRNNYLRRGFLFDFLITISWIYLRNFELKEGYTNTWIFHQNIKSDDYITQYLFTFYIFISTLTNVGKDHIQPQNSLEIILYSITLIIILCAFIYSIISIGTVIYNCQKKQLEIDHIIRTLQNYLQRKNADISLIGRARNYLLYLKEETKNINKFEEDQIIQTLSKQLQDDIIKETNTKLFYKMSLFLQNFSHQTNAKLIYKMEEIIVSPNQVILQENQLDDQSIYFIAQGLIEIFHCSGQEERKIQTIQVLQQNQYFGEISFFSGNNRTASARSVNFSTLYKITRKDFLEVIRQKDEDFQRYKMIQEQILFQNNLNCIRVECYGCSQLGHIAKNCPKIHSQTDNQAFILKLNFPQYVQRNIFYRRMKSKQLSNARLMIQQNNDIIKKLKQNLHLNPIMFDIMEEEEDEEEQEEEEYEQTISDIYQTSSKEDSYHDENISPIEEISQNIQKPISTKYLNSQIKQESIFEKESTISQFQQKENDYNNNIIQNSSSLSPQIPSIFQDCYSEQLKEQCFSHPSRYNSELTRINADEEQIRRPSCFRKESSDKNSQKQEFSQKQLIQSFRDLLKRNNSMDTFQSLAMMPSLLPYSCKEKLPYSTFSTSNEPSSFNGDFDKRFNYYYEQINEPSIQAQIKDYGNNRNKKNSFEVYCNSKKQLPSNIINMLSQKEILEQIQKQNSKPRSSYLEAINSTQLMSQFDKMQCFSKFFPHNNFKAVKEQLHRIQERKKKQLTFFHSITFNQNINKQTTEIHNQNQHLDRDIIELIKENELLKKVNQITSISYGVGEKSYNAGIPNKFLQRKQIIL